MSIVAMKKLRLIAVQSQKKALLEDLLKLGCVEISEPEVDLEGLMNTFKGKRDDAMERRSQQIKILNALKVLDQYAPVKKGLLTPKPEADKDEFLNEEDLRTALGAAEHILELDGEIRSISARESRERSLLESLQPWENLDLDLDFKGTKTCDVLLGALPVTVTAMEAEGTLTELDADVTEISADNSDRYIAVVYRKEIRDEVLTALRELNFSQVSLSGLTGSAHDNIILCNQRLKAMAEEKQKTADLLLAEGSKRAMLEMGADAAVNVAKEDLQEVMKQQGLVEGFDVGLEMSGSGAAFKQMLSVMRNGGKVSLLGLGNGPISLDMNLIIGKGLTLQGIYGRKMDNWHQMSYMVQGGLDLHPVITHRFHYTEFEKGFEAMHSDNSGKVIFDWTKK